MGDIGVGKKRIVLFLPLDIAKKFYDAAKFQERKISNFATVVLREHLDQYFTEQEEPFHAPRSVRRKVQRTSVR